jgi:hypothetical protein
MLELNYKDLEFQTVENGVYEGLITGYEYKETQNGRKYISLNIAIRNDIEQKFKNSNLFYSIWTTQKPDVKTIEGYVAFNIATVAKACGLPEKIDVSSLNELLDLFIKKPVRVTVEQGEYNGKIYANITKIEQSTYTIINHKFKTEEAPAGFAPVSNNDIPF